LKLTKTEIGSYFCPQDPGEKVRGPHNGNKRRSITEKECLILQKYFCGFGSVLEIGTGLGISTQAISEVVDSLVTVDVDPWVWGTIWPSIKKDNVLFASSASVVSSAKFDGIFVDGCHTKEAVVEDCESVRSLTDNLIIFHDAKIQDVADALDQVFGSFELVDTACGLGIVRPKT
jgi:hypothetical protein